MVSLKTYTKTTTKRYMRENIHMQNKVLFAILSNFIVTLTFILFILIVHLL